jgi:acetolactate synthase I/II/III large subunit
VRGIESIAAETLVDAIRHGGADTVFGVPGGGPNLALIGAAEAAGMRFVLSHSETAGAITAATYGLLTGAPAMAIATRGPGLASAVNGAAQATLDRFPLLCVSDCVPASDMERVAHQRIDQTALMAPVTKWSGRLGGDAAAAAVARSAVALAGAVPRGAVHLDFDPGAASTHPASPAAPPAHDPVGMDLACSLLADSDWPVVIVGIGAVDEAARVRDLVERMGCPVLTTYQSAGMLPEGHPQLAGLYTGGVVERPILAAADLVIAVGLDTVEPIPAPWRLHVPVVSIDVSAPASTFLPTDVTLVGPSPADLLERLAGRAVYRWPAGAGAAALADVRHALMATSVGAFGPVELAIAVARCAPAAATATVDAGAHFLAIMPFWPAASPLSLLISNGLATMGFALPAAIGAALARPGAPVVCMVGDGGLGMALAELETVARLRLPITVVVFDDAALSLIEIKQQQGQGGAGAVHYSSIDFSAVARGMGLDATTVETVRDLERALDGGWETPRLIDARIDPTPYAALLQATRG